ncbi:transposase [Rubrivivax sp. A210]|uniref:IS5 family transposase n=1 Tax=Rubrivivax sp. A210 TaxID=2772301 RepID=UPI00191B42CE|nr:IS5 family transposase [Rubrivivax sp. A210]CAD5373601.1 transposase [Rubrivivax sp. A210]
MKQTSFASAEYAGKKRQTRRERFLAEMNTVVPWSRLEALIEPHYPKSGKVGRPPIGVPRMLRMYFLQQWYTLADEALEDALYDSQAMREFIGIDLGQESVPDATTLLKFRRLLEQHDLTAAILAEVNAHLSERGLLMRQGTVVDATIIAAPSSTKNEDGMRDPEMHQTKKGQQWHFGMKMHSGVDAESGLIHSVVCTAAHEADVVHVHELRHGGQESQVHGDSGYTGLDKREEVTAAQAEGRLRKDIDSHIAMKRGQIQAMPESPAKALFEWFERRKAQVRAIVEHPFLTIKNLFGYRKVSYRGIAKNEVRAKAQAALVNLYIARRRLMAQGVSARAA